MTLRSRSDERRRRWHSVVGGQGVGRSFNEPFGAPGGSHFHQPQGWLSGFGSLAREVRPSQRGQLGPRLCACAPRSAACLSLSAPGRWTSVELDEHHAHRAAARGVVVVLNLDASLASRTRPRSAGGVFAGAVPDGGAVLEQHFARGAEDVVGGAEELSLTDLGVLAGRYARGVGRGVGCPSCSRSTGESW